MGAFDYPTVAEIREVLGEEGWWPTDQPPHPDEAVLMIDIDAAAEAIDRRLRSQGYMR